MISFGEINTAILSENYSEEDLRRIIRSADQKLRFVQQSKGLAVAGKVRIGMKVGFGDKSAFASKRSYKEGKVVQMNRTRAVVLVDDMRWTVPFEMLTIIS